MSWTNKQCKSCCKRRCLASVDTVFKGLYFTRTSDIVSSARPSNAQCNAIAHKSNGQKATYTCVHPCFCVVAIFFSFFSLLQFRKLFFHSYQFNSSWGSFLVKPGKKRGTRRRIMGLLTSESIARWFNGRYLINQSLISSNLLLTTLTNQPNAARHFANRLAHRSAQTNWFRQTSLLVCLTNWFPSSGACLLLFALVIVVVACN